MTEPLSFKIFFEHFYIIHPESSTLSEEDQKVALVASVILGICTLGILHFGCWIAEKCIIPGASGNIGNT